MAFAVPCVAQQMELDRVPPPLKSVSQAEHARLDSIRDAKKRTETTLELMAARLTRAEAFLAQDKNDEMHKELGGFAGLMDNILTFLTHQPDRRLSSFKRLEIGLRRFPPRLEMVRRGSPIDYEPYVRSLLRAVRDARAKAVEPLFGETVMSDPDQ